MNVVDCSVLGKLLLAEPKRNEVRAWFEEAQAGHWELTAPDIVFYELGNVLARALPHADPAELGAALEQALARLQMRRPAPAAVSAIVRRGLTFYDAAYVAVAQETGATLVTLDDKMAKVARKAGISVKTF